MSKYTKSQPFPSSLSIVLAITLSSCASTYEKNPEPNADDSPIVGELPKAEPKNISLETIVAVPTIGTIGEGTISAKTARVFNTVTAANALTTPSSHTMLISHCLGGLCPQGANATNRMVVRKIYALSNNGRTKFPDWVAYHPNKETDGTTKGLLREWERDKLLPANETLTPKGNGGDDYKGANKKHKFERGHLAPLAAFAATKFWRITNRYSNITPQTANLNKGPWFKLEKEEREALHRKRRIFVLTGPLYETTMDCDPKNRDDACLPQADLNHHVPSAYWKVVSNESGTQMSAFIMNQTVARKSSHCDYRVEIEEIQRRTGFVLFPSLTKLPVSKFDEVLGCKTPMKLASR